MIVTRKSPLSGKLHIMDLPITVDQFSAWREGVAIQKAMPHLTPAQREFVKSGITEEEWAELFADVLDEEDTVSGMDILAAWDKLIGS